MLVQKVVCGLWKKEGGRLDTARQTPGVQSSTEDILMVGMGEQVRLCKTEHRAVRETERRTTCGIFT